MKSPAQLADSDKLPDDLKLLLKEQKVPTDDPLIAVLAWHWLRINESRDALQDNALRIGALLDERFKQLDSWSKTLQSIFGHLEDLSEVLSKKPLGISQRITSELAHPISQSVTLVHQLSADAAGLMSDVNVARKRLVWSHIVTGFLGGFSTGTLIISWIYSHIFLHLSAQ